MALSPENVLKRAEELVNMEKPASALELLYDTILSKRTRNVSLAYLDPIVLRFVELAVLLRKGKIVKDGLHQYKKLVVPASVPSLDAVVTKLLTLAEEKVETAQIQADQLTVDDEDLEAEDSPEDLLMATVSSEQTKDRTDREVVTPWLKFLWESYRTVLDVLRNNAKLEEIYAKVASQAFQFCLKYNRKTEFRRLVELLRNHLQLAAQQAKQPAQQAVPTYPVDLNSPETLQLYLDARFNQLNVAVGLELWQEAFRSVEDVHTLLAASRRPIKIGNMVNYYETLARIFAVSNNHLFHAAAWAKFYSMAYHTRNTPKEELQRIASFFLLSVMCIPANAKEDFGETRSHRLSSLLNLSRVPSRESLMQTAMTKNVLAYVSPEVKQLYHLLEQDFHPLQLKERLSPVIDVIGKLKAYQSYIKPLLHTITSRLVEQLSQVYTTVKLSHVIDLATLPAPFNLSPFEIERLIVLGAKSGTQAGSYAVRIDHQQGSVTFLDALSPVEDAHVLEPTPGALLCNQLRELATCLSKVVLQVDTRVAEAQATERAAVVAGAARGLADENAAYLNRKQQQQERQQAAKQAAREREQRVAKERAAKQVAEREAEQRRLAEEAQQREIDRMNRERKAATDAQKREMAEEINAKGIIKIDLDKLDELDSDKLRIMQVEQLERETNSLRDRMTAVARRYDHMERALRKEEAQLWSADGAAQEGRDREAYNARKVAIIDGARRRFDESNVLRERYSRMTSSFQVYLGQVNERRAADYAALKAKNDAALAQAKDELREKVLAERKAAAEQAAKDAEEKERRAAEQAERERKIKEAREAREALAAAAPKPLSPAPVAAPASRASPFGAARPSDGPKPSPVGAARPSDGPRSSPFGNAKPSDGPKPSPFGAAKPSDGPKPSPFGAAKPSNGPKPNPFGNAKPSSGPKASPFGNARPVETKDAPADKPAEKPKSKFVPSALRRK